MVSNAVEAAPERMSLAVRAAFVAVTLFLERWLLSFVINSVAMQTDTGITGAVWISQHWGIRFAVTLAIALGAFSYVSDDPRLASCDRQVRKQPVRVAWLALHAGCVLVLTVLLNFLYGPATGHVTFSLVAVVPALIALAAGLALIRAMAPWALWWQACKALGWLWLYAALAAALATIAWQLSQGLWQPTAKLTFDLVRLELAPLLPGLQADPAHLILNTQRFAVQIQDACSGLEGVGLMLVFCCAWLLFFRKEYIFPRALLLIPAGLTLIFILNILRIGVLVLMGHAGLVDIAIYGFHSQAGWITFNCAAAAIVIVSRHSAWLNRSPARHAVLAKDNTTAAYLMPFLSILAAGMISRAASSGFENLYGLRLIAGALALSAYWPKLATIDWRFSWRGPVAGVLAFGVWWLGSDVLTATSAMPTALVTMSSLQRVLWIAARTTTAVCVVPIAEELAFRGYLLRRIAAGDFESVDYRRVGRWALLVSALVFGLAHGAMWLPATAVGLIYGVLVIRRGRIGESVAAHVTTNGLIALCVLLQGQWQLW